MVVKMKKMKQPTSTNRMVFKLMNIREGPSITQRLVPALLFIMFVALPLVGQESKPQESKRKSVGPPQPTMRAKAKSPGAQPSLRLRRVAQDMLEDMSKGDIIPPGTSLAKP